MYTLEDGVYKFHHTIEPTGDEKLAKSEVAHASLAVCVAYLPKEGEPPHIFTHGTPEHMVHWMEEHNAHSEHKAVLFTFPGGTPADAINAAVADPKVLASFLA